jgi:ABC-type phosphate/phosphonate transport system substrate-binding protein
MVRLFARLIGKLFMFRRRMLSLNLIVLAAGFVGGVSANQRSSSQADTSGGVKIVMVETLFADVPQTLVNVMARPFSSLIKEQAGVNGQLIVAGDALHVGRLLHENRYQLGIFQGIEFAWAQQKFPDLRPLMLAVSKHHHLHAKLVVDKDADVSSFASLKGKTVALPLRSKAHVRLFLEKNCAKVGDCDAKDFFGKITRPSGVEDALNDILLGNVQAAVVDSLGLEYYAADKPGCYGGLKVIQVSEPFPTGVIAYRDGVLDKKMLDRFKDGMVNANKSERAVQYMNMFQLTAFESVPADFPQTVANILKAYPPRQNAAVKTSVKTGTGL